MTTHLKQYWRLALAIGLVFFVFSPALQYGAIWDHRARPTPGVKVMLRDGRLVTGTLSREWSRDWVLSLPDGERIQFAEKGSYDWMEFQRPAHAGTRSGAMMLLEGWRSFLPVLLAFFGCMVLVVSAAPFSTRRGSRDDSKPIGG
jgi:hypothetical protein